VKPSEPSSPRATDIQPAPEREITESPNPQPIPAKEPGWENRVLPSLEHPDPACRFSWLDAIILVGCCVGCLWLAISTGWGIDSSVRRKDPSAPWVCGLPLRPRDLVFNFLLGLGPACPLIFLNQYTLRGRRTWLKESEWLWLLTAALTVPIFIEALPHSYQHAIWKVVPESILLWLFVAVGCWLPILWLLLQAWFEWRKATWTEYVAVVSVPLLFMVGCVWVSKPLL